MNYQHLTMPSAEEPASRFLRAAAAQFHKNGCFEPFFMEFSYCYHADFHGSAAALPWKVQALAFKACTFVPYALS